MDLNSISNADSVDDIYYIDWDEQMIIFVEPFNEVAELVKNNFGRGKELLHEIIQEFFELESRVASTITDLISILILGLEIGTLAISRADPVAVEFGPEDNATVQYSLKSFLN